MKLKLLFPCDYYDKSAVDSAYSEEYAIAKSIGFDIVLFNYDEFLETKKLNTKDSNLDMCPIMYRGWMLKSEDYFKLESLMWGKHYMLINSGILYEALHHFDEAYTSLEGEIDTPKTITVRLSDIWGNNVYKWQWFDSSIGWVLFDIKKHFKDYFIMKDNVKSAKGTDFPEKISVDIDMDEFTKISEEFKEYRGNLYTGEIILKQYEPLKRYADTTNEWRVFYFLNKILTVDRNSNQSSDAPHVPDELINNEILMNMDSMFYTIDFAETEEGKWIVIETGDGQVSGLSPNQNILEFYTKIQNYWKDKYGKSKI